MSESDASGGSSNALPVSSGFDQDCKGSLHVVIENQIIPRLLNVLPMDSANAQAWSVDWPTGERPEFLAFTQFCLQNNADQANLFVDNLMDRGLTASQVFMELVTPAARHLGELWDRDECGFTQVTCGLAIMHQMIYRLGYESPTAALNEGEQESVMLACAPGSQHFLGLTIVADLYRNAGANVVLEIASTESELLRAVSHEWFDVVGISVALEVQLQSLPSLIQHLRAKSGNPQVKVVLGGPVFLFNPISAKALGADAIFTDAQAALQALKNPARLLRSD